MSGPGTGFEKSSLVFGDYFSHFCVFLAEQWNHDVIASSKTGILPNWLEGLQEIVLYAIRIVKHRVP